MRHDSFSPILASLVLVLALLPPALAGKAPAFDSTRFHLVKVKHRLKQSQRPHWSHRAPGTKRQTAVQGLLCALGVTAACDGSSGPAIDTASDPNNCASCSLLPWPGSKLELTNARAGGRIGNVCPSSLPNSIGAVGCQAGQCISSCVLGYSWDVSTSSCINTATDTLNCGSVGRVCSTPTGTAAVTCLAGFCLSTSCAKGYSYRGGTCAVVPFSSDPRNCGRPGLVCPTAFENGQGSVCDEGRCRAETCDEGYQWDGEAGECTRSERDDDWCVPLPISFSASPASSSARGELLTLSLPSISEQLLSRRRDVLRRRLSLAAAVQDVGDLLKRGAPLFILRLDHFCLRRHSLDYSTLPERRSNLFSPALVRLASASLARGRARASSPRRRHPSHPHSTAPRPPRTVHRARSALPRAAHGLPHRRQRVARDRRRCTAPRRPAHRRRAPARLRRRDGRVARRVRVHRRA